MADQFPVRIFFEGEQGQYQDTDLVFTLDNVGSLPAVGDVILPPRRASSTRPLGPHGVAWQVVKRYFKLNPFHDGYTILVVRERARLSGEVEMDQDPLAE